MKKYTIEQQKMLTKKGGKRRENKTTTVQRLLYFLVLKNGCTKPNFKNVKLNCKHIPKNFFFNYYHGQSATISAIRNNTRTTKTI